MFQLILLIITPVISLIIFTLGSGLLTTLLTIRLHAHGGGAWIIGTLTAVYYAGLVLGSFLIGHVIKSVGHIRVHSTCAALLAASVMLQGIFVSDSSWLILRFITGFCTAGLYVAIESWLLVISPINNRGQILSIYMVSFYAALACGQFFLNISDPGTIVPFCIVTILASLSIVPMSITQAASPSYEDIAALSMRKLYNISESGVIGCFAGGLITSVVYGVMPLFAKDMHFSDAHVALMMGLTIGGAMLLQYPFGRLSDFMERRKVLIGASFATAVVCIVLMLTVRHFHDTFLFAAFFFGGVSFTLYPLSISLTCDYLDGKDIVAATQGLLLANGFGSIVGPLVVPALFYIAGPLGIFVYFALIALSLGIFFAWKRSKKSTTPLEEQQDFVVLSRTTPVANELDPRAEG